MYFIAIRGTGEKIGARTNMLYQVFKRTAPHEVTYLDLDYPASIALANESRDPFGSSLSDSVAQGGFALIRTVMELRRSDPTGKIVVGGYSLGCLVALSAVQNSPYLAEQVDHLVLVANPALRTSLPIGSAQKRWGTSRYTGIVSGLVSDDTGKVPTLNVAHPDDPISGLHPKSPLRSIAPWLWALDLDDMAAWFGDIRVKLDHDLLWSWTRIWDPGYREAVMEALPALRAYARGGAHTTAYGKRDWMWEGQKVSGLELAAALVTRTLHV